VLKFVENNGQKIVEIYDKKKKLIFKATYYVIGLYNVTNSIWYWGWFIDFIDRDLADKSKDIKIWGKKIFEKHKPKTKHDQALYFYTKNGSFMTNIMNVNFFIKLAMYIFKGKWFFETNHSEEGTNAIKEYIVIQTIIT